MKRLFRVVLYAAVLGGLACSVLRFRRAFESAEQGGSAAVSWLGALVACAVVLGLLVAWDVSRFLGCRAERFFLEGETPPVLPDAVREAERLVKEHRALDAVNLLREHLQEHPRDHYVQVRIAEIYADVLNNPLAAALEYEALLEHKLDAERWGWTAIRLARLHHRLRDFDKAERLLEQVATRHPKTSAARKARKLLGSNPSSPSAPFSPRQR